MRIRRLAILTLVFSVGASPAWANFFDATGSAGLTGDIDPGAKVAWGDYDNDGNVDILSDGKLYRNSGGATPTFSLAHNFGDINNDGYLDVYSYNLNPPELWLNNTAPNGTPFSLDPLAPLGYQLNARGASFADHDSDGAY